MYISTEIGSLRRFYETYEERLSALKEAGFDAYDFSMFRTATCPWISDDDCAAKAEKLRRYADRIGIACNQTHAPFPLVCAGDENRTRERFDEIVRALEISAVLGAKICVVHPWNDYSPEENAKIYEKLGSYAKKFGVAIALENMWNWNNAEKCALPAACSDGKNFKAHLDLLDEKVFCALVDIGHAEMKGLDTSAAEMIKELGGRVKGIHLHDNDLKNDLHKLPFTSEIDYKPIVDALAEIDYRGDITLESENFLPKFPKELVPDALKLMAKTADYFRKELQKGGNRNRP